ncbi:MAG TPA: adenylate/guanylate cyclase domain-containing protein [Ohtaekwangia sp.]|uniref:adenylate/guanylate cyclase domain-containing protein n=1 Tax=Ohtaekwangia sp. TaxID=2066019 RepID=UPI002F91E14F
MKGAIKYTMLAHRYTARYPLLTYVGTQVNFWVITNLVLVAVLHLEAIVISGVFNISVAGRLGPMVAAAVLFGLIHGLALGITGYKLDHKIFRNLPLGTIVILKTLISLVVLLTVLALLKYVLFAFIVTPPKQLPGVSFDDQAYSYTFLLLMIYYFFMTLVISFINQVNKRYGPGIVIPLLLGQYRTPKEEQRIFMFMDLKSSTATAERLGHLKYSSFIRDCFSDINDVLYPHAAQVYQYVGDEIVVTWAEEEGLKEGYCVRFFFACKMQFEKRAEYYRDNYGSLPEFKASLHSGPVTAVEIGEVKREIAYHGDTLNTAARIQSVCNDFQRSFLVSEELFNKVTSRFRATGERLGTVLLKGKASKVGIVSIDSIDGK